MGSVAESNRRLDQRLQGGVVFFTPSCPFRCERRKGKKATMLLERVRAQEPGWGQGAWYSKYRKAHVGFRKTE